MIGPENPRALLKELEGRAKKRFGQHFLNRVDVVQRMVRAAGVKEGTKVVEIGPGLGILTQTLLDAGADVLAVEVDTDLQAWVAERYPDVHLVREDATQVHWAEILGGERHRMVANLPYNVGTQLVMNGARLPELFSSLTVMLQAEVVHRMVAGPGSKTYGSLSVELQARGKTQFLFPVPPGAFVPPPKVTSAVLKVDLYDAPLYRVPGKFFDRVVRSAFSQRRKTVRNAMTPLWGKERALAALHTANIDNGARAEAISVEQYLDLADALYESEPN